MTCRRSIRWAEQIGTAATAVTADPGAGWQSFVFGEFRLDLVREQLIGPNGRQVLRRQAFATLRMLLHAAPALVSLDELLDGVWGRHAISPSAVPHVIVELRRALGDSAHAPSYIETRHRRGYRMIPQVIRQFAPEPVEQRSSVPAGAAPRVGSGIHLLDLLEEMQAMPAQASTRHRLNRLHSGALQRGLPFLALQAQLALQAGAGDGPGRARDDAMPRPPAVVTGMAARRRADGSQA